MGKALITLLDEGSNYIGKRASLVPYLTTGDVLSFGVVEDTSKDFFPAEQEDGKEVLMNLLSVSWKEFRRSGGGTIGRTPCIIMPPS